MGLAPLLKEGVEGKGRGLPEASSLQRPARRGAEAKEGRAGLVVAFTRPRWRGRRSDPDLLWRDAVADVAAVAAVCSWAGHW